MFVIRPPTILTTPKRIANELNIRTKKAIGVWQRDFFSFYHPKTRNQSEDYKQILQFALSNKANQRRILHEASLACPQSSLTGLESTSDGTFLRRPLRHFGGIGYHIQQGTEHNPNTHYVQRLFPKTHEYRIIWLFGEPIITLLKRNNQTLEQNAAWNHINGSYFITITNMEKNRLRHSDVYDKLKEFPIIKHAHIIAADIMWNKHNKEYSILELNLCPGISIDSNISLICSKIKEKFNL